MSGGLCDLTPGGNWSPGPMGHLGLSNNLLLFAATLCLGQGQQRCAGPCPRRQPRVAGTPKVLICLHVSHQLAPLSFLWKAAQPWSTWHTWRCCHGNPSCPSWGQSVCLQACPHGPRWCPVLSPWKGTWCVSGSICEWTPGSGQCPVERETLSQPCVDTGTSHWTTIHLHAHLEQMKNQVSQAEDWCQLTELMVPDATWSWWTGNPP